MVAGARLWGDFSFVGAGGYGGGGFTGWPARPKFPKDLAAETNLRIVHVSRALREMGGRDLVACLNPAAKARGRLYGVTEAGTVLLKYLDDSSRRFVPPAARGVPYAGFVPKIR